MSPRRFPEARHLLLTDIGCDGMLQGPNFDLYDEAAAPAPAHAHPGIGRGFVAGRSRATEHRRRDHRQGAVGRPDRAGGGARPCPRVGSSPASTSRTGASSRACSSATIAMRATSSSRPCAIATKGRTSLSSTTSPRAPRAAASIWTGSGGSRASSISRSLSPAASARRDQAAACLDAGADKVSVNSPALERPELIDELARDFGSQCVVLGVDSCKQDGDYWVKQYSGKPDAMRDIGRRTLDWVRGGDRARRRRDRAQLHAPGRCSIGL